MAITALSALLPQFADELRVALAARGEVNLAEQVNGLTVYACSYDPACNAGYIRVESDRTLNVVEQNIIGTRHGRTVPIDHPCDVYVDADNFDRITGIELLEASKYAEQLGSYSSH